MNNAKFITILVLLTVSGYGTSKITSVWKASIVNQLASDKISDPGRQGPCQRKKM
ncbi:hypothetical protein [Mucilaginibacter sp.]|jgi:hypothetical protein|uniref:hypothetical protein n=1 Tax=Mucilaginibacter sp. TaxID=1882438 RepID=UPI0035678EAF